MNEIETSDRNGCAPWDPKLLETEGNERALEPALAGVLQRAVAFAGAYRGKLTSERPEPAIVLAAIREYEAIHEAAMNPCLIAHLLHASDTGNQDLNRRYLAVREAWTAAREELIFLPLELASLSAPAMERLEKEEALSPYRPFLHRLIRQRPHLLSEREERVIQRKDLSRRTCQRALYDELTGSITVHLETGRGARRVTTAEVSALQHAPDRSLRATCLQRLFEEIEDRGLVFTNLLNALILDRDMEDRMRGYTDPMHRVRLANGIKASTVEALMGAVERRYFPVRRYFRAKAAALGVGMLETFDISAPLETVPPRWTFPEVRALVLQAAGSLDPRLSSLVSGFFDGGWIDSQVRKGKLDGAFCACFSPSQHPFVAIHYSGGLRDAMVLAHELGHGIHYRLASGQPFVHFKPPPVLAETAATFMEIALARHLMRVTAGTPGARAVFACLIEGIITTVFRQNVLTRFEQAAYRERRDHALRGEEIGEIWLEENARLYGGDVRPMAGYRWGWAMVPHFFHRPYYGFSYVFGNLLAIALYQRWESRGRPALDDVLRILASGGRVPPPDLVRESGLNVDDVSFWEGALDCVEGLIDAFDRAGGHAGLDACDGGGHTVFT